jgi:CDP-diacylglycerol---glycerol-3-phosphate 3-phosphatidyltransferase
MANLITLARFPFLGVILLAIYFGGSTGQLISVGLIVILILMDSMDGMVARRRNETSLLGSALDIAADRSVEFVFWVVFAHLGLIPLIIPLLVIIRGTLTDSIRAVASSHGVRAFDMAQASPARFLVGSPVMRSSYAVVKALAFCGLCLTLGLSSIWGSAPVGSASQVAWLWIRGTSLGLSWTALVLCLARGLPVLIEAPSYLRGLRKGGGVIPS